MPNLSDFFPDELKEQFANSHFNVGAVLRYHVDFTTPPKIKRFVIVGFDQQKIALASVLINSEINPNIFPTPELKALHLELEATNRDYLEHTSYVDCSQIIEQEVMTLKELLADDPSIHLGELDSKDLAVLLEKIRTAGTIPAKIKKKFGLG
jgi:hypothetical protein